MKIKINCCFSYSQMLKSWSSATSSSATWLARICFLRNPTPTGGSRWSSKSSPWHGSSSECFRYVFCDNMSFVLLSPSKMSNYVLIKSIQAREIFFCFRLEGGSTQHDKIIVGDHICCGWHFHSHRKLTLFFQMSWHRVAAGGHLNQHFMK